MFESGKEMLLPILSPLGSPAKSPKSPKLPKTLNSSPRDTSKHDRSSCIHLQKYLTKYPILNVLLPITFLVIIILFLYAFRHSTKLVLIWIETQNSWIIFCIFMVLFALVSFPLTIGYLILIISSGYLFGTLKGLLVVILGANVGVAIAHITLKSVQNKIPIHRLIKNETAKSILRVISGPRAFRVVLFARLTPIPFGLQNTIFGISSVKTRTYHAATLLGLLPAQTVNVYLGSKLRSIHDVLNDHHTALAGYGVFVVEIIVGSCLMIWVIQKARAELATALLADLEEADEKLLLEIDV